MYTIENIRDIKTEYPVEGMRDNWAANLVGQYRLLKTKGEKAGFLTFLYSLVNSELPGAYLRSEPIARFQAQLHRVKIVIGHLEQIKTCACYRNHLKELCQPCVDARESLNDSYYSDLLKEEDRNF